MPKSKGRLITVDGIHGADLIKAGRHLCKAAGYSRDDVAVSAWDASGIFFELSAKHKIGLPSPKTLLILYAADLAFRLRWEIEPALKEGRAVIAAPYVQTALAAGCAAGIPRSWTASLLRFAPEPNAEFRLKEKPSAAGWTPRRTGGFAEFFALGMKSLSESNTPPDVRDSMIAYWKYDPRAENLKAITDKALARIKKHGL